MEGSILVKNAFSDHLAPIRAHVAVMPSRFIQVVVGRSQVLGYPKRTDTPEVTGVLKLVDDTQQNSSRRRNLEYNWML